MTKLSKEDKQDILNALLGTGDNVMMYIDTSEPLTSERLGLVIPKHLSNKGPVPFEIGYNLSKPIPDLEVTDDGVSCSLSFSGRNQYCFFPWKSILGFGGNAFQSMSESEVIKLKESLADRKERPVKTETEPKPIKTDTTPVDKSKFKDTKVPWLTVVK